MSENDAEWIDHVDACLRELCTITGQETATFFKE